ncbi:hypothetical protein F3F96_05790 [Mariprofundus sp. NF]|uniref:hypothetical protein n=1 Tax=Mariprofundus sp. NF TaxID=2608716 RepID=UPI00159FE486|nr:hypothetical protein [Mariprofundus sp. NF]NWF38640.1 hypothetical protein [Mariprofundus sp. NF]
MGEEFKDEHERAEFLLAVLLNREEAVELRNSAAVYLGHFDSEKALNSLIEFACNDLENERLLISCGDAIAEIWDRNHDFDINVVLSQVAIPTKDEIKSRLASR